jgi:TonB family protein
MRKKTLVLLFLACSIISGGVVVQAQRAEQTGSPLVTKAVAPSRYPPIAIAAHAKGKVIVEVKIAPTGEVLSSRVIQGHTLLASTAASAAKLWQFEKATDNSGERSATLTFIFQVSSKKEDEQISFNPPYEVLYSVFPNIVNEETPGKKSRANQ